MKRRNFIAGALALLAVPTIKANAQPRLYGIEKAGEWVMYADGRAIITNWHLDGSRVPFWMRWNREPIAEFRRDGRFFNLGREVPSLSARIEPGARPMSHDIQCGARWGGDRST